MTARTEWWESFFAGLWLDVQRQVRTEGQTRAEADFIEELLELEPPAKILDVPCGEGRLSIELASQGYQVTGVDITRPLLEDGRRKAAKCQIAETHPAGNERAITANAAQAACRKDQTLNSTLRSTQYAIRNTQYAKGGTLEIIHNPDQQNRSTTQRKRRYRPDHPGPVLEGNGQGRPGG